MGLFRRNKDLAAGIAHDVHLAKTQAAQMQANLRANGFDTDELIRQAQSGAASDLMAMSRRAAALMANGIEMPATVRSITVGQSNMLTGAGAPVTVGVTVQPPASMPYEAAAQQVMANEMLAQLHEGVGVTVKVAPDDAQSLMVWSVAGAVAPTAPSAGPAAPGTVAPAADRVARLTKLQSLRAAGAISDEEFAAQKARILAE